jgi:hypothetical protein
MDQFCLLYRRTAYLWGYLDTKMQKSTSALLCPVFQEINTPTIRFGSTRRHVCVVWLHQMPISLCYNISIETFKIDLKLNFLLSACCYIEIDAVPCLFAEMHRTVLNQILRQTNTHLADGPFSVLAHHTRILDFDVKRRYFRTELDRLDEGIRREELAVHVRRSHVFEDSFRELHRRSSEEWKNRFYIVFEGMKFLLPIQAVV